MKIWLAETGELIPAQYVMSYHPHNKSAMISPEYYGREGEDVWVSGAEPLLWTTRRDKGGKEIYEGDIVRWLGSEFAVTWLDSDLCFALTHSFDDWDNREFPEGKDVKIVGDIYGDPELLSNHKKNG